MLWGILEQNHSAFHLEKRTLIQCVFNTPPPPFVNIMLGFEDLLGRAEGDNVCNPTIHSCVL